MEKIKVHSIQLIQTRGLFINERLQQFSGMTPQEIINLEVPLLEHITAKKIMGKLYLTNGSHRVEVINQKGGLDLEIYLHI